MTEKQKINDNDVVIHTKRVKNAKIGDIGRFRKLEDGGNEVVNLSEIGCSFSLRSYHESSALEKEIRRATPQEIQDWFDSAFEKLKKQHSKPGYEGFMLRHAFVHFIDQFNNFTKRIRKAPALMPRI